MSMGAVLGKIKVGLFWESVQLSIVDRKSEDLNKLLLSVLGKLSLYGNFCCLLLLFVKE